MEELKLAFETIVVGLLAIPWLLIVLHIIFYPSGRHVIGGVKSYLQESEQSFALIGTVVLGIAYCLGTIIFPLADHLFNKNHTFFTGIQIIRADDDIKKDVLAELYFKDGYYQLDEDDFPRLPDFPPKSAIETIIEQDSKRLSEMNDEEKKHWLKVNSKAEEEEKQCLYEELDKFKFHSIYTYQKYSVYNLDKGYEILKPLSSRIVVLRGAVFNGVCLLFALIFLFLCALGEALWKLRRRALRKLPRKLRRKLPRRLLRGRLSPFDPKKFSNALFTIFILTAFVLVFCLYGAWGVYEAEREYDKNVVGLFYGHKDGGACQKLSAGGNATDAPAPAKEAKDSHGHLTPASPKARREKAH